MGKRTVYKMTAAVILACLTMSLAGCADQLSEEDGSGDRLKIVCTVFPEYDWVRQILGEHAEDAELTLLMKNGADLHSYQPTVWDIQKIAEADLFLYVGGESDFWVEEVLAGAPDPERKVLNLMEILEGSVQEEEHVEGMQAERGHATILSRRRVIRTRGAPAAYMTMPTGNTTSMYGFLFGMQAPYATQLQRLLAA